MLQHYARQPIPNPRRHSQSSRRPVPSSPSELPRDKKNKAVTLTAIVSCHCASVVCSGRAAVRDSRAVNKYIQAPKATASRIYQVLTEIWASDVTGDETRLPACGLDLLCKRSASALCLAL